MKINLFIIVIVQIVINTECRRNRTRMLSGGLAMPGEFPFAVAILGNNYHLQCTGTLVTWKKVLTAAHCVQNSKIKVEYCLAGENYAFSLYYDKPMKAGQKRGIVSYVMHPEAEKSHKNKKGTSYANDLAFITVDKAFFETHSVALIEIGALQLEIEEPCVTIGFGSTNIKQEAGQGYLRSANTDIVGKSHRHQNLYIVGTNKSLVTTGDSGGPLVDTEISVIIGVCCGRAHDLTASYYVNLAEHRDWIKSQIGQGGIISYRRWKGSMSSNCEIFKVSISTLFFLFSIELFSIWFWSLYLSNIKPISIA